MDDPTLLHDLRKVDADVARTWARHRKWKGLLARGAEAHADEDPFEAGRYVAGQSTYEGLGELTPMSHDVPLRDALRRWVHALTEARVVRPLDIAWAHAAQARRAAFHGENPRRVSWTEAWRAVPAAKSPGEATAWLRAAEEVAPELAGFARERAATRLEVARRMGLEHPSASVAPVERLRAAAATFLARTEDLAASLRREARGDGSPAAAILAAVARDAPEGWPAHLTPRWLEDHFAELARGVRVDLPALPSVLGASSFARALFAFGHALRVASRPAALPFALAQDPQFVDAHRLGFVFAALAMAPEFYRVGLGTVRRVGQLQARVLARTALLEARMEAARWLLGDGAAFAPRDTFEELSSRLFGSPLAPAFAGAWPAAQDDHAARLAGLFTALPLARELVERFDVDWFSNPRVAGYLRARAAVPAHEAATEEPGLHVDALARTFEEALG